MSDKKIETLAEADIYLWYLPIIDLIIHLDNKKKIMKTEFISDIYSNENGIIKV